MGNMGAFITIKGEDLTPQYTTFEAVVSVKGVLPAFVCY